MRVIFKIFAIYLELFGNSFEQAMHLNDTRKNNHYTIQEEKELRFSEKKL